MEEIWKPITGYKGLYEISNYGRVKSLAKTWKSGSGRVQTKPETIMRLVISGAGYPQVILRKDGYIKAMRIYWLVWDAFSGMLRPTQKDKTYIDHKDEDKLNSHINNLQLLSPRENSIKSLNKRKTDGSLPIGVKKHYNKFNATIRINGKKKYLGSFPSVELASQAYRDKAKEIYEEQ